LNPSTQVYGEDEWSFGFCETGSGVFSCPVGKNPMYTYWESIVLEETECGIAAVNQILRELSREWPGHSYDLLSRNCNHFCDVLYERLGVPKLPGKDHGGAFHCFLLLNGDNLCKVYLTVALCTILEFKKTHCVLELEGRLQALI